MKRNRMGNLLSIAGDDAEDIKRFIDSFLSQDSESDDPEEIIVGGYDEEGNKDPELITFIYKSGFKDSLTAHDTEVRVRAMPPEKNRITRQNTRAKMRIKMAATTHVETLVMLERK